MSFRLLGSRLVGRGRLFRIERLHLASRHGSVERDVVRHPGGVAVLPVDGQGRVVLLRQYRAALGRSVLEVPAGIADPSDPSLEQAARRELEEETGIRAGAMQVLATVHTSPGYTDEELRVYLATGIVRGSRRPDGAEEHEAELVEMSREEALAAVESGAITDSKTVIALLAWDRRHA